MDGVENDMNTQDTEYEWNAMRKLWHLLGCILMVVIFLLWKDVRRPVYGPDIMVGLVWVETALAFAIDLVRFYSPRHNEAVKSLPFYGKLMRTVEVDHFNASTYYLLAAAILCTSYRLGGCREATVIMAILVLGVADPAAAWTRFQLRRRNLGYERVWGLLAFIASSFLIMWAISAWMDWDFSSKCLLATGLLVALIESYTKYWVIWAHPLTVRVQRAIAHHSTVWLFRFYPDDNLLIPLTVAMFVGMLSRLT